MSKARTLADFISDGSEFADGTISVAEVSGAAPLASPAFTADASFEGGKIIINEVTGSDAYSEIRKTNGGSNFAIVSPEALYLLVDSDNNQTNRGVVIGHNSALPGSATSLAVIAENGTVFNESGADLDFRVESTGHSTMLFVDASTSRIGIGQTNAPQGTLHIDKDIASGENYGIIQNDGTANTNTIAGWVIRDGSTITSGIRRRRDGSASPTEIGSFGDESVQFLQNNVSRIKFNNNDDSVVVNEGGVDADFRAESDGNAHALFVDAGNNRIGFFNSAPSAPLHLIAGTPSTFSDAFQIGDGSYTNIAMYSGAADGEIRIGAAGSLRGRYAAQYAGTRSAHQFSVGVNNTNLMNFRTDKDIEIFNTQSAVGGVETNALYWKIQNSGNTGQYSRLGGISTRTVSNWGGDLLFHTKPANATPDDGTEERMSILYDGRICFLGGAGVSNPKIMTYKFSGVGNGDTMNLSNTLRFSGLVMVGSDGNDTAAYVFAVADDSYYGQASTTQIIGESNTAYTYQTLSLSSPINSNLVLTASGSNTKNYVVMLIGVN